MTVHRLEVHGGSEVVTRARTWASGAVSALGGDEQVTADFVLAVSEACTNVVRYAYADRANSRLILTAERRGDDIVVRMRDFGDKFDPARVPLRPIDGELTVGGYGMYLMRQVMDEVRYITDHPIGTELVMVRRVAR
jgi:anti-sigma regulatory factor (Ser/Thr protein kinase)